MATRLLALTDDKRRDAQVAAETARREERYQFVGPGGRKVAYERLVKATERYTYEALVAQAGTPEALAQALVDGDPEIDYERVGRRVGDADRVWVRPDGSVLFSARVLQVVYGADGQEKSRADFSDVEATVREDVALPWSGRLMPAEDVVRRFAFARKLQLRHVNGLTFDFLYDIAKTLDSANKLLFVGSGPKGQNPLILATNGSPYRGFLEGRVDGDGYRLVLHLTNLELKPVVVPE